MQTHEELGAVEGMPVNHPTTVIVQEVVAGTKVV